MFLSALVHLSCSRLAAMATKEKSETSVILNVLLNDLFVLFVAMFVFLLLILFKSVIRQYQRALLLFHKISSTNVKRGFIIPTLTQKQ